MGIKLTKRYLKSPGNKIHGDVLYSDKYAITSYSIPKNGILTVVPNFDDNLKRHTSYVVIQGLIHIETPKEVLDAAKGDAIEIDNDTPYFLVEADEDSVLLSVENGTSTYVQDITKQLRDKIEEMDHKEAASSVEVMEVANHIAKYVPWTIDIEKLSRASLIYDIGKIEIDKKILNKPGKLTEEEFEIIKQHPEKSLKYLAGTFDDPIIRDAVIEHHERLDGSGYPRGLKDNDISKEAKILMVADMYCALTSNRTYRKNSFSPEEAYEIIRNDCNKNKLDKDVVLALRKALNEERFNELENK
jgi:HD-GYP domain-containing protein (c-di-GMP phosphodiesterase class II)